MEARLVMYIAKFGLISMNGHVAKLAASHDFGSYVSNLAFLQATHKASDEIRGADAGRAETKTAVGLRAKKELCLA